MQTAYLIGSYGQYRHLRRLLTALLEAPGSACYVHLNRRYAAPADLPTGPRIHYVARLPVYWGGWSHQLAILRTLERAFHDGADRYVLLSGTDYPVRPVATLQGCLSREVDYINLLEGFHAHKPEWRVRRWHFDNFDRRARHHWRTFLYRGVERLIQPLLARHHYPFERVYHGSTWWALRHATVAYVLEFLRTHPEYVRFFRRAWCPEECLFPTILGNSHLRQRCRTNLTYTDWSTTPAPAVLTRAHLELLARRETFDGVYGPYRPLFARKFLDTSGTLIDWADEHLRLAT